MLQAMAGAEHGGAEAFFSRLVCALHESGIQQHILTRPDEVRIKAMRDAGLMPIEAPFGGIFDFSTKFKFNHEINRFKPDIILTWMNRATKFCPYQKKAIVAARMGGFYNLKYYKNCDYIVGNTKDIVDYVVSNGWDKERVYYLPNFVDGAQSEPVSREKLYIPKNAKVIFALGRFHENKAFDVLVKALAKLPEVYCIIAGDGPLRQKIEEIAKDYGSKPRIRFIGWQENVASFYAASDIFVCPSRHEPLGNVVIEAWAQKLPVIASDASGPVSLIENGKNGILFPVDDDAALVNAIKLLLSNKEMASNIAEHGYKSFAQNYKKEVVVKKYKNFFEEILKKGKRPRKG
ncbi:MAG: glycosyltransferase [Alphaproteobacteria bacterium]